MSQTWQISDWLHHAGEIVGSRETWQLAVLQLALIAGIFGIAWLVRLVTRPFTTWAAGMIERHLRLPLLAGCVRGLATLCYAWLLLVIGRRLGFHFGSDLSLLGSAATLTALWVVLRISACLLHNAALARFVSVVAWGIAALDLTGLLDPTTAALDSLAVTIGAVRVSLLLVIKTVLLTAMLLWAALALSRLVGTRLQHLAGVSRSVQTLAANLAKIILVSLALLIALNAVGIDLTAFAVFSGAIGIGLGFGLQKVVSNFICGIILLLEQSVKPGDVIEVGHTFGEITALAARYTSVRGRDGKEYLIPNETLITNPVTNWSYSSPLLRLDINFGVGYGSDLRQVRQLAIEAAASTKRVLASPAPVCHITEFGDNGVNLLLRFWIEDPAQGVTNVKGNVFLALWDACREHNIELPYPQRDIRIRELPREFMAQVGLRSAAD